MKIKFTKSLFPHRKWDEIEMPEHKVTPLVLKHSEIVSWEKKEKLASENSESRKAVKKKKNKAILETKENK